MMFGVIFLLGGALMVIAAFLASKTDQYEADTSLHWRVRSIFIGGSAFMVLGVYILTKPYLWQPFLQP